MSSCLFKGLLIFIEAEVLERMIAKLDKILIAVGSILLFICWGLICYIVIFRTFMEIHYELYFVAIFSFVWGFLIFMGPTLRDNRHVSLTIVVGRLSPKLQYIIATILNLIGVVFCSLWAWWSIRWVTTVYQKNILSAHFEGVVEWPWVVIMPVAVTLLTLFFLERLLKDTMLLRGKSGGS